MTGVVVAAPAREAREAVTHDRYRGGELGLDVRNMRERLAAKGLRYVDHPEEERADR